MNVASPNQCTSSVNMSHVIKTECHVVKEDLSDVSLKEELSKFWDYDTLGVKEREEEFYEDYLTKVRFNGGRYEASLPFKSKPELLQQYDSTIKEQLNSGVLNELTGVYKTTFFQEQLIAFLIKKW